MSAMIDGTHAGGLASRWKEFLIEGGYRPTVAVNDEDPRYASIQFKAEGRRFAVLVDEEDPSFLHLDLGYVLEDVRSDVGLLEIANTLNASLKVVKVTVEDGERLAHFQAESFGEALPSSETFERLLSQLMLAADQFLERVQLDRPRALA